MIPWSSLLRSNKFGLKGILADSGSSTSVLFLDDLLVMRKMEKYLKKVEFPLIRFARRTTYPIATINLPVGLSKGWKTLRTEVAFILVDTSNSYNAS